VSLFAYDNGTFIVESFRDQISDVTVLVPQGSTLTNLVTGEHLASQSAVKGSQRRDVPELSTYKIKVQPHSYQVFATTK
jgi:hypothetical protein